MEGAPLVRLLPGAEHAVLSANAMTLTTDLDGFVDGESDPNQGLYCYETRFASKLEYRVDGRRPIRVIASPIDQRSWLGYFLVPARPFKDPAQHALEILVHRELGDVYRERIGVRTLSSDRPSFNPYSYHRGSVWPTEKGTILLGLAEYGFHGHVERLARALFESAALFDNVRLPETMSGHPRNGEHPFPAVYPRTNWPQAWSSTAVIAAIQAMAGIMPLAPLGRMTIAPHLPAWLPELTLRGLRVGPATMTIRLKRRAGGDTSWEVTEKVGGDVEVIERPMVGALRGEPFVEAAERQTHA